MLHMNAVAVNEKKLEQVLHDINYIVQDKLSGIRAFIFIDSGEFKIITRGGHNITRHLPHIRALYNKPSLFGHIFDCELADFSMTDAQVAGLLNPKRIVQGDTSTIQAYIFDVFKYRSTVEHSYMESCKQLLKTRLDYLNELKYSHACLNNLGYVQGSYDEKLIFARQIFTEKKEGVMFKNLYARYIPGNRPQNNWFKWKRSDTYDVVITGFTHGKGKYQGFVGAIQYGQYLNNKLYTIGTVRGFTNELCYRMSIYPEQYIGQVIEIMAQERTESLSFKHPRFIRFRFDKKPQECTIHE